MKLLTQEVLIDHLQELAETCSQADLAHEIGVTTPALNAIIKGRKPIGGRVLKFLGYEKQMMFRKVRK